MINLKTKKKHVKTLIHISDVHIRLFKRHSEYEQVFNNLYNELDKLDLSESVIVVTGDIVHAKTDMSPEMVRVCSDFLSTLSSKTDTIVILGNHDLNLSNPNRLDALTPIIKNLNHPSLHFLYASGVYKLANCQFGNFSIIGSRDEWPNATLLDNSLPKIALYHGPVDKATTDVGYNVHSRVTVDTFNGYDMVLLGDIHKAQILQEYSDEEIEVDESDVGDFLHMGWIVVE